jgi:hypothetical protein
MASYYATPPAEKDLINPESDNRSMILHHLEAAIGILCLALQYCDNRAQSINILEALSRAVDAKWTPDE